MLWEKEKQLYVEKKEKNSFADIYVNHEDNFSN